MGGYKHIETCFGNYISAHYTHAVEVGIGMNMETAKILHAAGITVSGTDVKPLPVPPWLSFAVDDVYSPCISLYRGADLIYAIRPAIEMIPALITLARTINCDLLVYHLGFESYENGGERIDCGILLHRYFRSQKPSNKVD